MSLRNANVTKFSEFSVSRLSHSQGNSSWGPDGWSLLRAVRNTPKPAKPKTMAPMKFYHKSTKEGETAWIDWQGDVREVCHGNRLQESEGPPKKTVELLCNATFTPQVHDDL